MELAEVERMLQLDDLSEKVWCPALGQVICTYKKMYLEQAENVCDALLRKVEEIGCKDKHCVRKIIDNIYLLLMRGNLYLSLSVLYQDDTSVISSLLQLSLTRCYVNAIRYLLNYGYVLPVDVVYNERFFDDALNTICDYRFDAPEIEYQVYDFDESLEKVDNQISLLKKFMFTNGRGFSAHERGFKRIVLAAICIWVLQKRNTNKAEQFVQGLRLYFRAVTDPFIEAEEFGEVLRFCYVDVSKDSIDAMIQDFKRLYPESQGPYRPRSLKHLCRCAIRQTLTPRSELLPALLDHIGFPRRLKMYIMGDL